MSAQIPETMLLSDLLKATGYDCPEELQGRTFAEATAGGDVQTNKASTIDVSAYTEPIVIKPDTDYESMKKTTVTLSNIPQTKTEVDLDATENGEYIPEEGKTYGKVTVAVPVGATKLYGWAPQGATQYFYTGAETPQVGDKVVLGNTSTVLMKGYVVSEVTDATHIKIVNGTGTTTVSGQRDSALDIDLI